MIKLIKAECPLWVKSRHAAHKPMSAKCQKPTGRRRVLWFKA